MKIRKLTYAKGEWILRLDKQMYKHLDLVPGLEYVFVTLEEDGSIKIRRFEGKISFREGVKCQEST